MGGGPGNWGGPSAARAQDHAAHGVVAAPGDDRVGETIRTTDIHPFWVEGRGWTLAENIAAGDVLRTKDGNHRAVLASRSVTTDGATAAVDGAVIRARASGSGLAPLAQPQGTVPVYNLDIGGLHTFFVSRSQILVHNK